MPTGPGGRLAGCLPAATAGLLCLLARGPEGCESAPAATAGARRTGYRPAQGYLERTATRPDPSPPPSKGSWSELRVFTPRVVPLPPSLPASRASVDTGDDLQNLLGRASVDTGTQPAAFSAPRLGQPQPVCLPRIRRHRAGPWLRAERLFVCSPIKRVGPEAPAPQRERVDPRPSLEVPTLRCAALLPRVYCGRYTGV